MSEPTRKLEFSIDIDAPPELVWKTLTEGEGITRWFAPEARVEPGAGGSVTLSWGPGMEATAPISVWDPPHHFQHGSSGRGVDYHIEARAGGGTVLRLVHSGFGADASFDQEYDSTAGGWATFLAMLAWGLNRHPREPHKNVTLFRFLNADRVATWETLIGPTGFHIDPAPAQLSEGDAFKAATPWGETLTGKVIRKPRPNGYLSLSVSEWNDAILSLFVENCGGSIGLTITCVLFGDATARAEDLRGRITSVAADLFPEPASVSAS